MPPGQGCLDLLLDLEVQGQLHGVTGDGLRGVVVGQILQDLTQAVDSDPPLALRALQVLLVGGPRRRPSR